MSGMISAKGKKTVMRTGYAKYNVEEVWGKNGLIGANYWSKKTGNYVKSKRAVKGKRIKNW